ncbi:MAG: DUF5606 domain-containing protein [Segetibacter sp.]|jgi:hypothetical protein|nr:DUF5606 domain-containing protein [Segetibacter sp.]
MEYGKIISVTGLGGLFELVGSKKDGAIVRSLDDKSTKFVASRVHNFSHLESIEVYTQSDNVNLAEVFQAMEKSSETLPDEKDAGAVKEYYQQVFPQLDFERVYASDMKKMIKWYKAIKANNVEIKLSEASPDDQTDQSADNDDVTVEQETKVEEAQEGHS